MGLACAKIGFQPTSEEDRKMKLNGLKSKARTTEKDIESSRDMKIQIYKLRWQKIEINEEESMWTTTGNYRLVYVAYPSVVGLKL